MLTNFFSSLRTRLMLLVLIPILPALAIIIYSGIESYRHVRKDAETDLREVVLESVRQHEQAIQNTKQILFALSKMPIILSKDSKACSKIFAAIVDESHNINALTAVDEFGDIFANNKKIAKGVNYSDRSWFQRVVESGKPALGDYIIGRVNPEPMLPVAYPVYDPQNKLKAILCAGLDLSWLSQVAGAHNFSTNVDLVLIDQKGTILLQTIYKENFVGKSASGNALFEKISGVKKGFVEAEGLDGELRLYTVSKLEKGLGSPYLCVGVPKDQLFASARKQLTINIMLILLVGLFAVVSAWQAADFLVLRHVRNLVDVSERLGKGEFSARAARKYIGAELGSLATAFDDMAWAIEIRQKQTVEAMEKYRQSEERFRSIFEASKDCILVWDQDYNYLYANQAAIDHVGTTRDKVIGKNIRDGLGHIPEFMTVWMGRIDQAFKTGQFMQVEDDMQVGDKRVYSESAISPLKDSKGNVFAVGVVYRDVTERKKANKAILRQSANLEAINEVFAKSLEADSEAEVGASCLKVAENLTSSQFGWIGERNVSGRMDTIAMSDPGMEAYQLSKANGELAIKNMEIRSYWEKVLETGQPLIVNDPEGHPRITSFLGVPLKSMRNTIGMIALANKEPGYDSDDLKTIENLSIAFVEALMRKREQVRLRQQFARMSLLSQITRAIDERQDLESIFQVALQQLERELPIDFSCMCFFDSISDTLILSTISPKGLQLVDQTGLKAGAVIFVDQNGLRKCVNGELVYEPIIDQTDQPLLKNLSQAGLRSVFGAPLMVENDVQGILLAASFSLEAFSSVDCEFLSQLCDHIALSFQNTRLYENLQKAYDELRETQKAVMEQERLRAMGQMASGLSHDINNALGPITLYTESLLESEENLSDRARRYLKTIETAAEDIANTIGRMREFYRKREEQIDLLPVTLNSLVLQVIELTQPRWKNIPQERGIVFTINPKLQENVLPVAGIETDIRDALTNLIFNAVDAMPEGGTIEIQTRMEASKIVLEVIDTGIGMDEETRLRCLEPFFTRKGERGTGLGLAMVYGVMQRHQGDIEIESEPGNGTVIRLVFPVKELGAALPHAEKMEKPSSLHILCIDDDPLMRESLKETLESDGHRVKVADGGQEGLALFQARNEEGNAFDLVITDLGMPYMDGREVAKRVKHESTGTPVILLTGWGTRMSAEGSLPEHVDRVMSKPPKVSELRRIIWDLAKECYKKD